ncbi:hypothetical protein BDR26DRAFT_935060 [Obelidium mucronatum]|nr:hypothetical protein BDR26DRAFT_935060 [Obelidium mucronatum]
MKRQNCGAAGHRKFECPEVKNYTATSICRICRGAGHVAAGFFIFRLKAVSQFDSNLYDEYANLMAELSGRRAPAAAALERLLRALAKTPGLVGPVFAHWWPLGRDFMAPLLVRALQPNSYAAPVSAKPAKPTNHAVTTTTPTATAATLGPIAMLAWRGFLEYQLCPVVFEEEVFMIASYRDPSLTELELWTGCIDMTDRNYQRTAFNLESWSLDQFGTLISKIQKNMISACGLRIGLTDLAAAYF